MYTQLTGKQIEQRNIAISVKRKAMLRTIYGNLAAEGSEKEQHKIQLRFGKG